MKFERISCKNFKSFESVDIELDGNGFVKIDGVNNTDQFSKSVGSGKSTIADMLSYALTGETVQGNSSMSDVKNMYTTGKCSVTVEFVHNDIPYTIFRGEDGLKITENGVDISKHLRRDTQQLISEKFPFFTPTFLGATVIIGQNMPNSFTNNKPSARKQILEELTNSSFMIDEIKQMLADKKNAWQADYQKLTTDLVVLDSRVNQNNSLIARSKTDLERLGDSVELQKEISTLQEEITLLNSQVKTAEESVLSLSGSYNTASAKVVDLSAQLSAAKDAHTKWLMDSISEMSAERDKANSTVVDLRASIRSTSADCSRVSARITELKNTPTICPTCKQPLPNAHKIDTSEEEAELARLSEHGKELSKSLETAEKTLSELSAKVDSFRSENATNAEIEDLKSRISACNDDVLVVKKTLDNENVELRSLRGSVSAKADNLNRLQLRLGEYETLKKRCEEDIERAEKENADLFIQSGDLRKAIEAKQGKLSVLNQVISFAQRDFRTILLSNIIRRLDSYAKLYCKKMLETDDIVFCDDGNNISITFRGRDFGVLSGGESQIVKMCITLALKKTLEDLVGFNSNIIFFDEILDNLDQSTAQQMIELVSTLNTSSTFFISHHEDVFLPIDRTWTVTKNENISTLCFD